MISEALELLERVGELFRDERAAPTPVPQDRPSRGSLALRVGH